MSELTQALIDQLGPLTDGPLPAQVDVIKVTRECMSIAMQLDGRIRGRALPGL